MARSDTGCHIDHGCKQTMTAGCQGTNSGLVCPEACHGSLVLLPRSEYTGQIITDYRSMIHYRSVLRADHLPIRIKDVVILMQE